MIYFGPLEGLEKFGLLGQKKQGQGALAADAVSLTSTFKSISLYTNYPSVSPQVKLDFRKSGSANWIGAQDPFVDIGDNQVRGSIVGLAPDTNYEVRVTFVGGAGGEVIGQIKTKSENIPLGSGKTYYVSTSGNDTNPGTEQQPFKTIQKAADSVAAGDTVYVKGGTYNEQIRITASGTAGNYITFLPYNNETVVIDGAGSKVSNMDIGVNSGGSAQGGDFVRVSNFKFYNAKNPGVNIGGDDVVL